MRQATCELLDLARFEKKYLIDIQSFNKWDYLKLINEIDNLMVEFEHLQLMNRCYRATHKRIYKHTRKYISEHDLGFFCCSNSN